MKALVAAIIWLAPGLGGDAARYADLIAFEARWYRVDPLLVVALIQVESGWKPRKRSVTNDYGLLQVHVSRSCPRFKGRERELFDPRVGIREGVRILSMWREFHDRYCRRAKLSHPYWAHFKWGRRVRGINHATKVRKLYEALRNKFRVERFPDT